MEVLTKSEIRTKTRINNAYRAAEVLDELFDKGFVRSLPVLVDIVTSYFPEMQIDHINNFWHFRNVSDDLLLKMESVVEKLKAE